MERAAGRLQKNITTLEACILIEETCGDIYRQFAEIFNSQPEISALWLKIAADEDSHREQFQAAYQINGSGYVNQDNENYLLKEILVNIRSLQDGLRDNIPTLKEALIISAILERSVENYHVETGRLLLDDELADLIARMSDYDKAHKEIFQLAANELE
jgi:rubrerythrin